MPDLAADLGTLSRVAAEQVRADLDVVAYARTHPVGSLAGLEVVRLASVEGEDDFFIEFLAGRRIPPRSRVGQFVTDEIVKKPKFAGRQSYRYSLQDCHRLT